MPRRLKTLSAWLAACGCSSRCGECSPLTSVAPRTLHRYNTKDNLAALLSHGTVVGETAKFYSRRDGAGTAADESKAAGAGSGAGSGTGGVKCPLDLSGVPFAWDKVGPITEASCNTAVEAQLAQVMEATGGVLPPGMSKYMVRGVADERALCVWH